uniref:Uncharacterized protein n=1 Tax=Oryza sativa subsp. japonica TaxID=39947 RepID=Q6YYM5_ORYSJ|nr:hypothetical protein [Oryza sativa Japonica Group]
MGAAVLRACAVVFGRRRRLRTGRRRLPRCRSPPVTARAAAGRHGRRSALRPSRARPAPPSPPLEPLPGGAHQPVDHPSLSFPLWSRCQWGPLASRPSPFLSAADVWGPRVGAGCPLLTRRIQARVGVMEFGWALRRPMRLPDSPRHERGLPAALRGVGVKPEKCSASELKMELEDQGSDPS